MFAQLSRLFRSEDRPRPEKFWNCLKIETRKEILQDEGFSPPHIQNICFKRWKELSETERIWLFTPLLLVSLEGRQKAVQLPDKLDAPVSIVSVEVS